MCIIYIYIYIYISKHTYIDLRLSMVENKFIRCQIIILFVDYICNVLSVKKKKRGKVRFLVDYTCPT